MRYMDRIYGVTKQPHNLQTTIYEGGVRATKLPIFIFANYVHCLIFLTHIFDTPLVYQLGSYINPCVFDLVYSNLRGRNNTCCTEWSHSTKFPLIGKLFNHSSCRIICIVIQTNNHYSIIDFFFVKQDYLEYYLLQLYIISIQKKIYYVPNVVAPCSAPTTSIIYIFVFFFSTGTSIMTKRNK